MQPRVVVVGPLITATTTKVGLTQTPPAVGYLALNGAANTIFVANNICASQSGTAATALLLNGVTAQTQFTPFWTGATVGAIAVFPAKAGAPPTSPIYITSAGNESAHNFVVVGTGLASDGSLGVIKETITGANTSVVASVNSYKTIISITSTSNTTSSVTVGWMGYAVLDVPRQVITTSSGDDSDKTITVTGTDWAGNPISESFLGGNPTATSTLSYATVTSVKVSAATAGTIGVGTNGVAYSQWINFDTWAQGSVSCQAVVSGTVNYTVQTTNDDPNSVGNPVAYSSMTWDSIYSGVAAATTSASFAFSQAPAWARILLNSGSGTVTMTAVQYESVPY